jgi:hypothetical protein
MIRRITLVALALGGLNLVPLAPAEAQSPVPSPVANGRRCTFSSVTDPDGEPESQVGQINAGPLAAASPGASIQITCTIQVGGADSTHAGADTAVVTSTVSLQVASIPPTEDDNPPTISYVSPENTPVFLCTEAIINGVSWYWDATPKPMTIPPNPQDQMGWTDTNTALCNEAIQQEIFPGPICAVLGPLGPGNPSDPVFIGPGGDLWVAGIRVIDCEPFGDPPPGNVFPDPIICPLLALFAGTYGVIFIDTDGDVWVNGIRVWDCPVYGNTPSQPPPTVCVFSRIEGAVPLTVDSCELFA